MNQKAHVYMYMLGDKKVRVYTKHILKKGEWYLLPTWSQVYNKDLEIA